MLIPGRVGLRCVQRGRCTCWTGQRAASEHSLSLVDEIAWLAPPLSTRRRASSVDDNLHRAAAAAVRQRCNSRPCSSSIANRCLTTSLHRRSRPNCEQERAMAWAPSVCATIITTIIVVITVHQLTPVRLVFTLSTNIYRFLYHLSLFQSVYRHSADSRR